MTHSRQVQVLKIPFTFSSFKYISNNMADKQFLFLCLSTMQTQMFFINFQGMKDVPGSDIQQKIYHYLNHFILGQV